MSAVDDVHSFIETQGLAGGSTGWDLLRRTITDAAADQLVMVTEDGGSPPEIAEDSGIGDSAMRDIGVLVAVRAGPWDGDTSAAKAEAILNALHGQRTITVGATTYLRVRALTPEPIFVGFGEDGRPRHTVAFRLLREIGGSSSS